MANSPIGGLPEATNITNIDLFVLEQNGVAKKLSGAKLTEFIDRQIVNVTAYPLAYGSEPVANFDKITGNLTLGIPKGNSIVAITLNSNNQIVYTWEDGTSMAFEKIQGETGKSAYDYAVENGYTGTEQQFIALQIALSESGAEEQRREEAETNRQSNYVYMMGQIEEKLLQMQGLIDETWSTVILNSSDEIHHTLALNNIGTGVVETTLII